MSKYYRKRPLAKEEEDALYQAALDTTEQRRLDSLLPRIGENFESYSSRVNFLLPAEFGPDRVSPPRAAKTGPEDKNWIGSGQYGEIEQYVLGLLARSLRSKSRKEVVAWMQKLVDEFLRAAEHGDDETITRLIAQDVPVNMKERLTGAAALHYIAAHDARPALRAIMKSDKLDYLIRDRQGRLPSELAFVDGDDPAMAKLLRMKEERQATERGIEWTHRPRPPQQN